MELKQILGNTYAIDAAAGTLVFYKTGEHEGILIDTGYAKEDRDELIRLFEFSNVRPKGIIVSHTHYDHAGNAQALKDRYGCPILATLQEAGTACSVMAYRSAYPAMTPREIDEHMAGECYQVDQIIMPQDRLAVFCGAPFGILPLYGHTPGHIGVITPDHVAYLADALMSEEVMYASKMPSAICREDDLKAKKSLKSLHCKAYVLAHRGVYTRIDELVDKNVDYILDRAELVYSCLEGDMSEEEWVRAVYNRLEMHSKQPFKCAVCERNMRSFIDYLADGGRVAIERRDGVLWYCKK